MLVIKFAFTANRYHATQWGRNVNEGAPEWPPSPWRILRGIVATWRRTLSGMDPGRVIPVLEAMASEHPEFRLPMASTGHTRHFMPVYEGTREGRDLVIDSFVAIRPGDPVFAMWPGLELASQQNEDLNNILRNMPYLGRAESWVEASLAAGCPGEANSLPLETGAVPDGDWEMVRTLTPRSPLKLKDLEVETSELRRSGRIDPEGAQWWTYVRRPDCFAEFRNSPSRDHQQGQEAQVVRFALSGKALPMAFDTLRWGDLARRCAMSQYGRSNRGETSRCLSGKDASGEPLRGHGHAFYLPTDEDGDGRLDHLTVWAPGGFADREFQAAVSVNTLNPGGQREPVQLVYEAHGSAHDFAGVSPLFGSARRWRSLTPYVLTRHIKFRGKRDANGRKTVVDPPGEQVAREVSQRWPDGTCLVGVDTREPRVPISPMRRGQSGGFRPFDYFRHRQGGSNGGGVFNFGLEFDEPLPGPLCLGFGCHYGLGIFIPLTDD